MTPNDLRARRKRLGLTQAELAATYFGYHKLAVKRWEAGTRPIPAYVEWVLQALEHRAALAQEEPK